MEGEAPRVGRSVVMVVLEGMQACGLLGGCQMLKSLFREAGKPGAGDLQVMTLTSDLLPSNQVTNDRAPTTEQLKQSTRWPERDFATTTEARGRG
jgi:hypothetical protein